MAASCFFLSRRVEGSEMIRWMLVLLSCAVGAFAYLGDRSAIAVLPLLLLNTVHSFFKFMCYDDVNIDFGFILAVAIHKLRCNLALLLEGALGPSRTWRYSVAQPTLETPLERSNTENGLARREAGKCQGSSGNQVYAFRALFGLQGGVSLSRSNQLGRPANLDRHAFAMIGSGPVELHGFGVSRHGADVPPGWCGQAEKAACQGQLSHFHRSCADCEPFPSTAMIGRLISGPQKFPLAREDNGSGHTDRRSPAWEFGLPCFRDQG